MKKVLLLVLIISASLQATIAQKKFFSKTAKISFYSRAPMEDIEAHNTKALSAFDAGSGQIEFSVLMKGFEFEKAKMQEHFNENYVESDKFPKAVFNGNIKNPGDLKLDKDGTYKADIIGSLTLHGVTKPQNTEAVFSVKNGAVSAVADFSIAVADYKIKIPSLVAEKISKSIKVVVNVAAYQQR